MLVLMVEMGLSGLGCRVGELRDCAAAAAVAGSAVVSDVAAVDVIAKVSGDGVDGLGDGALTAHGGASRGRVGAALPCVTYMRIVVIVVVVVIVIVIVVVVLVLVTVPVFVATVQFLLFVVPQLLQVII